ncbi:MAG: DUF2339 domain-containing protein, partial [Pirellulales bacterium]
MADSSDAEKIEQIREAVARLFERIREYESRLEKLEGSTPLAPPHQVQPTPDATPRHNVTPRRDAIADLEAIQPSTPLPAVPIQAVPTQAVPIAGVEPSQEAPKDEAAQSASATTPAPPKPIPDVLAESYAKWRQGGTAAKPLIGDMATLEQVVGERWLTWAGAFTMLVAVAFFIPWAWKYFSLPDWLKVTALHLFSFAVLVGAYPFYRLRLPVLGQVVAGLGIFAWYGTAFAALRTFDAYETMFGGWKHDVAFFECALITLVAIYLATRTIGVGIALVGALGGYLNPILTSSGSGNFVAMFTYLAFLNVALVASAVIRQWNFLKVLSLVATAAMFVLWIGDDRDPNAWHIEWMAIIHTLIFWACVTLPPVAWRRPSTQPDLLTLVGSSMGYMGLTWHLFHAWDTQQLGLVSWGLAGLHAVLFLITRQRVTNDDRMPRTHLALAVVFVTLSAPLQLDNLSFLAVAWSLEGLAFMAIGLYFLDRQMVFSAVAVLVVATLRLLAFDLHDLSSELSSGLGNGLVDLRTMLLGGCGLIMMIAGTMPWWVPRRGSLLSGEPSLLTKAGPFDAAAGGIALAIGNLLVLVAIACQWDGRVTLVLWTLNLAVIWMAGLRWQYAPMRWYAGTVITSMVIVRALIHGPSYHVPYHLIVNDRFASLALMAIASFLISWGYRTYGIRSFWDKDVPSIPAGKGPPIPLETAVEYLVGMAGHVILFVAINMEIATWFRLARSQTPLPFSNMKMAELATYSIVWALYAAAIVVMGFLLKSRFYRLIGLLAFGPILAKVFLVDLRQLDELAR